MLRFVGRRLLQTVPVVVIMSFVVFAVTSLLPGDAARSVAGEGASQEQVDRIREQLGLDDNVFVRYVSWCGRLLRGDLGTSLTSGQSVREMLAIAVPVTAELALLAILVALLIGLPAGALTATRRAGWIDTAVSGLALVGVSMPWFWLGLLLVLGLSLGLPWFPASGYTAFTTDPVDNLTHMVLPTLTVAVGLLALVLRQTRAALLNVMSEDYMRTATAKGLSRGRVVVRHGLRNALMPVVTVVGLQAGALLGGAVITETVFGLPGLGRMLVNGIFSRDYPVIQGAVLVIVLAVLAVNVVTDVLYAALDPRVQL
ncbi:ABC transporter permease [Phytohabitans sp. ZYX-F-186]|uniref:ABC transporter permease n=2 Tax=Phytohabitans TaxID=907364 RepID=A0ABU0ZSX0_9ACTN|nr:ABC transporter permease [Phytohabitans sp. ZYX-F-186]MDQ7910092.1 ABC transporter permease [Phytohabitans sp. ZYX-F-186]